MATLAGELYNRNTLEVPGFRLCPGMDTAGTDIKNEGRDIPKIVNECLDNEAEPEFNQLMRL